MNFIGSIANEAYAGAKYGIQAGQILDVTKLVTNAWNGIPFVSEMKAQKEENSLGKAHSILPALSVFNQIQQTAYRVWENKNNEWLYLVGAAIGSYHFTGINSSMSTLHNSLSFDLSKMSSFGSFVGGGINFGLEHLIKGTVSNLAIISINAALGGPMIPFFFLSDFTVGGAIGGATVGAALKIGKTFASHLGITPSQPNDDTAKTLHQQLQKARILHGFPLLEKKGPKS